MLHIQKRVFFPEYFLLHLELVFKIFCMIFISHFMTLLQAIISSTMALFHFQRNIEM